MPPINIALFVIAIILLIYLFYGSSSAKTCKSNSDCSTGTCMMKSENSDSGLCVNCSSCYNDESKPSNCPDALVCSSKKYCATGATGPYCEDCPTKGSDASPCPGYCISRGLCCPDKQYYTDRCPTKCSTCCPYKSSDKSVLARCPNTTSIA